jgi:cytochrome b6-f complex iron-sulfur subunit
MSQVLNMPHIVKEPAEPGEQTSRRAFLVAASAAGLCYTAALAYPIYRYLASPEEMESSATAVTEVTLKDAQKLPTSSVLMFKFGTAPAMLIHHEDGRWVALTAVCTHLGCTVQYEPQADRIHCGRLHRRQRERAASQASQALQSRRERDRRQRFPYLTPQG